ncbi:MAG: TIGR00266 family protein [Anaerolineae bacterium]|nr:TIGR00266 family protein [Anaerolineae bacterium]
MKYEIHGTVMQAVDVFLTAGQSVYTESGGMSWMVGDIEMQTSTKGGLVAGLGRALAGESLFLTNYTCRSGEAVITFTPEAPGKILAFDLQPGQVLICQKDSFMAADESVKLEMHFRKKLGAGLFGGEGFILQKVTGPGTVLLEIPGEVREYVLNAGETMKIDPGHIAIFETSVTYDVSMVRGVKNILFSGEGLFLATLSGPGKIWLQSLPLSNLARKLARYLPKPRG